jgi:hypothetical protein
MKVDTEPGIIRVRSWAVPRDPEDRRFLGGPLKAALDAGLAARVDLARRMRETATDGTTASVSDAVQIEVRTPSAPRLPNKLRLASPSNPV